jgi:hypothetical protein
VTTSSAPPAPAASAALACSWQTTFYPRDFADESSVDTVAFVVHSAEIADREVRLVIGYIGPGDFPRSGRSTSHADPGGRAYQNVYVDGGNNGGKLTVTLVIRGTDRKCTSPEYEVKNAS